jgi:hypothetical protein
MAVRAQYGIFYDRLIDNTINFVDANTPGLSQVQSVFPYVAGPGSDRRVSDGIPLPVRPAAPELRPLNARQGDLALFQPHLRTGYVQHYSLTLQRELFRNTVIEAGFVGNRGIALFMTVNPNQCGLTRISCRRFGNSRRSVRGTPVPVANTLVGFFGSANGAHYRHR